MYKFEIFNVNCNHCVSKIKNALNGICDFNISDDYKYISLSEYDENIKDDLENLGFKLGKKIQ
ncbi:hypothetical protein [Campylobacter sp. MG1]|uniref:hypothetical protein n=1 Tax=Campylobacter sp. MG1 TaxID=2976332 RepID=UPI00226C7B4A|nr:hypothetical protein [Campylobacter sp. MG1]